MLEPILIANAHGQAWFGNPGETTGVDAIWRRTPRCSFLKVEHRDGDVLAVRNGYGQATEWRRRADGMILRDNRPLRRGKRED